MNDFNAGNFWWTMLKGFLAGACISMGCVIYLSMENHIAGSLLFSLGLVTILTLGLTLYTGKVGYLISGQIRVWEVITAFVSNFLGCLGTALILRPTRIMPKLLDAVQPIAETKLADSYLSLFVLAIFCGVLMFIAAEAFKRGYWFVPTLCVMIFILAGFEHSIADMFYLLIYRFDVLRILIIGLGNGVGGCIIGSVLCKGRPFKRLEKEQ